MERRCKGNFIRACIIYRVHEFTGIYGLTDLEHIFNGFIDSNEYFHKIEFVGESLSIPSPSKLIKQNQGVSTILIWFQ